MAKVSNKIKQVKADSIIVHCSHTDIVDIGSLIPNPRNPNTHSEDQIKRLANIIKYQGWRNPIKVSKLSGFITAGHARLAAAQLLEVKQVPIDRQDYKAEADEWADIIADNKIAELAVIDGQIMADVILELDELNFDLDLTGLSVDDIADFIDGPTDMPVEDEIPEPPDNPVSNLGDLWLLGDHRLLCGDSTKAEDVERVMGGEKAILMATDPPYGVAYGDETGVGSKFGTIANDENNGPKLQKFLEDVFCAALPHLDEKAAWYLWHAQMTQGFFAAAAAAAADVIIHRQIIWVKPSLVLGHGDYHWRHELCFYGWRQGFRPQWYGDRKQTTVWEIGRENDKIHPTQKPVEVMARPMLFNTKRGDIAYEPFSGSGTTIIAAEQLNRKCYAIEIEPKYVDVALERWHKLTGSDPIRDSDKKKFSEIK